MHRKESKMTEKKGFPVNKSTIRSKEQYKATVAAAKAGCAWCKSEDEQPSPLLKDFGLVVVRKNVFPKPHRRMYIIHSKRCARMEDLTPEECYQIFQARHWAHQQDKNPGGGDIHRWGDREYCASSIPDNHYFESLVVPDGTGPVPETLYKDKSPEKMAAREKRAKTFTEGD